MFLFIALAAATTPQASPPPVRQARAMVRIVRPARADRLAWDEHPDLRKREVEVVEKDGRTSRVRLIEFE